MSIKKTTRSNIQMFGAWCGLLYPLGLILGWAIIAGFLPPHRPSAGADEIAAIFHADYLRVRIGMIIVMFTAMIVIPFSAILGQVLARIEDGAGVLAYSALLGGAGTMVLTFYPAIWWLVACYRPERSADLLYLFNDMSWLQFIGGVSLFMTMPASVAVAALCDTSEHPVFPRWSGYFNVWVILAILPDQLMFFFHSGPFAWNGVFGFWLPLAGFGSWFPITWYLLRNAIKREQVISAPEASK